jgi:1-acyl-sn-glycerol-3-phosphate acyltransferase
MNESNAIKKCSFGIKKFFQWILSTLGWTISGPVPEDKKCIIIVAPHTSNFDFILGMIANFATGLKANFLGKAILFQPPWGWLFYKMGGYPIKRSNRYNQVDYIVKIINKEDRFILGIAPEGSRSNTGEWKTGFYWIAKLAKIPIVMASFDYAKKMITFSDPFYPTENLEKDFLAMRSFFKKTKGFKQVNVDKI